MSTIITGTNKNDFHYNKKDPGCILHFINVPKIDVISILDTLCIAIQILKKNT